MRCGQSWPIEKHRFVGFDEDGGFAANIAVSEASDWTERAKRVEQLDTEYAVARDRGLN